MLGHLNVLRSSVPSASGGLESGALESGCLESGGLESRATDFGSGYPHACVWVSRVWASRVWGSRASVSKSGQTIGTMLCLNSKRNFVRYYVSNLGV